MRISDWSSDVCSSDLPHHEYWERHSKGEIKEIIRFDRNSPLFSREALTEVDLLAIPKERFPEYETRLAYAKALKNAPRGRRSGTKAQAIIDDRSEEHTSELQSLMRISYAVFCLKKKNNTQL